MNNLAGSVRILALNLTMNIEIILKFDSKNGENKINLLSNLLSKVSDFKCKFYTKNGKKGAGYFRN